jgi:CRISPR-associated endonuclease/helicase Cas3
VRVNWLTQEEQAIETILAAVEAGECVAWVRNTVDDAIRAFEALCERHPEPERCLLFHSRFAMLDRQRIESDVIERLGKTSTPECRRGQVLISTQVFQESLDCDVDLMISDLAPIDLLIQRAGRLQRHVRGRAVPAALHVLAPEWAEAPDEQWLKRALPGTNAVYRDTSLLWLTQRILRELEGIRMPEQARLLIEGVYGDVIDRVPDGLQGARWEQKGIQGVATSMANFNALELEAGYVWDRHKWQEEQEIGTRLIDEPTVNVALLKRDAVGALALMGRGRAPCRYAQPDQVAPEPGKLNWPGCRASYQAQWEALQERYKALRFVQPWLASIDNENLYDSLLGCLIVRCQ